MPGELWRILQLPFRDPGPVAAKGWITFDPTNRTVGGVNLIPVAVARDTGLFNALSERDGADSAVKDVFSLSEGKPV